MTVFSSNLFPKSGIPCPLRLQQHNSVVPFSSDFFLAFQKTKTKTPKTHHPIIAPWSPQKLLFAA